MFRKKDRTTSSLKGMITISILLAAFVLFAVARNTGLDESNATDNKYLQNLLKRSLVTANLQIADGVMPATNQWFSSLIFSRAPQAQPVYAWPLALKPTISGFQISQPQINSSADTIAAPFKPQIEVTMREKAEHKVVEYDDLSVRFEQKEADGKKLSARLTRGSPFLFMSLVRGQTLSLKSLGGPITQRGENSYIISDGTVQYGLLAQDAVEIVRAGLEIKAKTTGQPGDLALFAIPGKTSSEAYFKAAESPLVKTEVKTDIRGGEITTKYDLQTEDGQPTLYGTLPFASRQSSSQYGSFNTLEGKQTVKSGNSFLFKTKLLTPNLELDVSNLSARQKENIKESLAKEADQLKFSKNDTYFGGKELYRAAHLLKLAKQLGEETAASTIQGKLKTQLEMWLDPKGYKDRSVKYFYYDNALKGIVGMEHSFGSNEFNDHHFHYGYFLDAAAILSEYDREFLNGYRDFVELIIKDIANNNREDNDFPYQRVSDQYSGHSWASGFGKFDAGQNQESSSEAVHAWEALYRWGKVTDNQEVQNLALGLYGREAQAARRQWLSVDKEQPGFEKYNHAIVPLVWSGKLDYATFFDNSPEAKLAIQLIPLGPGSNYLQSEKIVSSNLKALYKEIGNNQPAKFKDYLVMYESLIDKKSATGKLNSIKPEDIDGAISLSYLRAFVYSQ
ncbi:hypothetical protein KY385_02045 [Candidatus Parcubacteria bacterium]|nr:hypothetical protein [Candidatus Parcubacteria bacterium]